MSTVRTVVHPGWLAVSGPEVDAVVEAADRHAESLEAAAADGLVALLEALTAHGLSSAPGFVACAPTPTGLRVVARGAACFVLPDGTRVDARGRMPWLDVDLDLDVADEGEVVLEAPEPQPARGWRRPARLSRAAATGMSRGMPRIPRSTWWSRRGRPSGTRSTNWSNLSQRSRRRTLGPSRISRPTRPPLRPRPSRMPYRARSRMPWPRLRSRT